jgi:fructose-specific phosphotransferase system IIC component
MKSALPIRGNLMEDQLSTAGVGFLGMLILGIIAGWIAEKVTATAYLQISWSV